MTPEENDLIQVAEALKKIPHFDNTAFMQLIEDTGPLVVLRILARFEMGIRECISVINQGIEEEDCESIWKACHKLTGSAELIGFKEFGAQSRKLNSDVKALPDIQTHLEELTGFLHEGQALTLSINACFPQIKNYL